ncbi:NAD(P)/FAD-dependent oxidoreductase [Thalassolituus sp. LLYu03]|uniref:NAD(P)/FAD-dependent oxidoreductase n=1 Tax=Thalassolituus sp. LLYu03 TaxID=3421656 RepID=UPI003D2AC5B3
MSSNSLVIIGNGMASNRVLEELGTDHPFHTIHVLSDEAIAHYNRIMLSPLLGGETSLEAITPHQPDWYDEHRVRIHLNTRVDFINVQEQRVVCSDGAEFPYQALIIATGSRSFIPAMNGSDADNVIGFRAMSDVDVMLRQLPAMRHATVIGAGLLGVEAATGLRSHGVDVTLIHRNPVLMNRQLDATASSLLEAELIRRDIDVKAGCNPHTMQEIQRDQQRLVTSVTVNIEGHDQCVMTDLVVFATGITPNKEIAAISGLTCNHGIVVNNRMQTSAGHIYALGECCEFDGNTYGLVAPIWDQAKVLADTLLRQYGSAATPERPQDKSAHYTERQHLTKLKVSGVDIHSIGQYEADDDTEVLQLLDRYDGVYRKVLLKQNKVVGALFVGDVSDSSWYHELMTDDCDVGDIRVNLLFGRTACAR